MNSQIRELLKPEILNTVSGLELVARVVVEGFLSGANKSLRVGSGQEFSQYRSYQPGDDLRQLDWKMFARSERYYIKQSEIETNIAVKFMLDASHSMAYAEKDMTKFQFAKVMIAALGYLVRKQSDTFGLYVVNDLHIHSIEPRFDQQQFIRFLNELIEVKSESTWTKGSLDHIYNPHGKELILFFTDLYDDNNDLQQFISRLKTPRNEVIVFHLMGKQEMELSYGGSYTFEDLETGQQIKADTRTQQKKYAEEMAAWISTARNWMLEKQVNYQLIDIDEPINNVLRSFLTIRKKLMR